MLACLCIMKYMPIC